MRKRGIRGGRKHKKSRSRRKRAEREMKKQGGGRGKELVQFNMCACIHVACFDEETKVVKSAGL
jgi:hypothetical protein